MADKRIYAVKNEGKTEVAALVLASNKAQALAHWARRSASVAVAAPTELIAATKAGVSVETAGDEDAQA